MSAVEDISWQVLRQIACDWLGNSAELDEVKSLTGGSVCETLALHTTAGERAVLKVSTHRVNLELQREAHQLGLLRMLGVPAPEVYICHVGTLDRPFSYVLMEFRDGVMLGEAKQRCSADEFDRVQEQLAEIVSKLHDHIETSYSRVGLMNGSARSFEHWPAFYRSVYDTVAQEADKCAALPVKCRKTIHKVHDRLDTLIAHDDCPRLLHWDLWSNNVLAHCDTSGQWNISGLLDPNCRYAHNEVELAYLELFNTVTPAFMRAYRARHPLPAEYHQFRRPIYQLYFLLDHLSFFGNDYAGRVLQAVDKVAALV